MKVKSSESAYELRRVVATMAIEDMYFDEKFLKEFEKIDNGEKTYDDLIKEVIQAYA